MAIITKIREKSGIAVGVVTIGLILFLIGGDLLSPNSKLLGRQKQIVGTIDGHDISLEEYAAEVESLKQKYSANLGRAVNESEMDYIRPEAWNQLVYKMAFQKEFDKLGIEVTDDEVRDMVQGNNIHPAIAQSFTNPQTQQVDLAAIKNFLANLKKAPAEQQIQYYTFETALRPERLREKYEKLFQVSTYATTYEAQREHQNQNTRANLRYVFIPFTNVPDSTIKPTEDQLRDYFSKHKKDFKREANRAIEYVSFSFLPSSADTAGVMKELSELAPQFASVEDDTAFTSAHSDESVNLKNYALSEIPKQLPKTLNQGEVYGPYMIEGKLRLYKVIGAKDDSVYSARASHILFSAEKDNAEKRKAAREQAEKALQDLKVGKADFDYVARTQSGDPSSASQGGDLGWFKQSAMVVPFDKAVFSATKEGLLPNLVETDYGFHIINVTGTRTKTRFQVASIAKEIISGDATREAAYAKAGKFGAAKNEAEFRLLVREVPNLILNQALTIPKDARFVNNLQGAKVREVVRWAYNDAKVGEVSPVFELDDQYLVCFLKEAKDKGEPRLEDVRDQVMNEVRKEIKAEQLMKKLVLKGTLEETATAYGQGATVVSTDGVTITSSSLNGVGYAPVAIGKVFAMKAGEKTGPFKDENGVMVMEVGKVDNATAVADYATYKTTITQMRSGQVGTQLLKAVKKLAEVEDDLARYY